MKPSDMLESLLVAGVSMSEIKTALDKQFAVPETGQAARNRRYYQKHKASKIKAVKTPTVLPDKTDSDAVKTVSDGLSRPLGIIGVITRDSKQSLKQQDLLSSESEVARAKDPKPVYSIDFERMWRIYPKRQAGNPKFSAWQAWEKALRLGFAVPTILAGTERYAAMCAADPDRSVGIYVFQSSTFLNKKGFLDDWPIAARRFNNKSEAQFSRIRQQYGLEESHGGNAESAEGWIEGELAVDSD